MSEKISAKYIIILLLVPVIMLVQLALNFNSFLEYIDNHDASLNNFEVIDNVFSIMTPFSANLKEAGVSLRYKTGETLQDGVFISTKALMKNLIVKEDNIKHKNTQAIINFNRQFAEKETAVYLMIVPSSSGVLKDNLPNFSTTVNQKNLIENTYNQFAGEISTINAYNILFENKDKYIYYRTEDSITPLGGYYLYNEMIRRMLADGYVLPINAFGVSYSEQDYYGNLFDQKPYKEVAPDLLSYYDYEGGYNFRITRTFNNSFAEFNGFYDKSQQGMQSYRYGFSGIIDVRSDNDTAGLNLLIIGDDATTILLPFISNHYKKVTCINVNNPGNTLNIINAEAYDQIVIAAGVDNYMNSASISDLLAEIAD